MNIDLQKIISYSDNFIHVLKRHICRTLNVQNDDIDLDEIPLKGGNIATIFRFRLDSKSYIVKYENKSVSSLSIIVNQIDLYQREYNFYEFISKYVNVRIPEFISLLKDEQYNNIGLILEDLQTNPEHKFNLNLNQESIDVSLKIINEMTKLHCKFMNTDLSKRFKHLKKNNDSTFYPFFENFLIQKIELFKNRWSNVLTSNQICRAVEICMNFSTIQHRLSNTINCTLVHGDIKSPNICYTMDKSPIFLDWQHCVIGKGTQDLVFFIIESFDINTLDVVYPLFKNYYYKKLLENDQCHTRNYSIESYETDLKDAVCYIPFFTCLWFGTLDQDDLIDKNWPYFFIKKTFRLIDLIMN